VRSVEVVVCAEMMPDMMPSPQPSYIDVQDLIDMLHGELAGADDCDKENIDPLQLLVDRFCV
jgi:hypothetical protein